jgi:hypothetical protein
MSAARHGQTTWLSRRHLHHATLADRSGAPQRCAGERHSLGVVLLRCMLLFMLTLLKQLLEWTAAQCSFWDSMHASLWPFA